MKAEGRKERRKSEGGGMKSSFLHPSSLILHPSFLILCLLLLTACGATVTPPPPVVLKAVAYISMGPLLTDLATA